MRDKLIELLRQIEFDYCEECVRASEDGYEGTPNLTKFFADHLLANDVIVLPCKVGQAVYYPIRRTNEVVQLFVREIVYAGGKIQFHASYLTFTADTIGKTVFLTKEQAEKALAERREP